MSIRNLIKEENTIDFTSYAAKYLFYSILKQLKSAKIKNFKVFLIGETLWGQEIAISIEKENKIEWSLEEDEIKFIEDKIAILAEHGNKKVNFIVEYQKNNEDMKIDFTVKKGRK
jgi:hypothetical protein